MKNGDDWRESLRALHFDLPENLIASRPAERRDHSRLMVLRPQADGCGATIEHRRFHELPELLSPEDLLILNSARVSPRRVALRRRSGAAIEALFLENNGNGAWRTLLRGRRKLADQELLELANPLQPVYFRFLGAASEHPAESLLLPLDTRGEAAWPDLAAAESFFQHCGEAPLPPYLRRRADDSDRIRYQTVYAVAPGSVAAPTAGLHFTPELLARLKERGIHTAAVALQIGYGTFAPLTESHFTEGQLHAERVTISAEFAEAYNSSRGRKVAVGTTSLRAVESWRRQEGVAPGDFETRLFLRPPDTIQSIDALITNFHLPGSSLLMLVACAVGVDTLMKAYREAIAEKYRFFSYGDAMLILPPLL
ncbi:MAG: tRNA preQ1(34) S-adenosylmethionine ribosyltransferase-isomerase QueA [Leptospirales bacterium]|nr:tRNA preQ1(34) S-adenosylmethionine ribosyltransferase-isomerase QueA [Leptospirales bacterium]